MDDTSHAPRATCASIRSTSIVIGGRGTEVADETEAEASSDSDPDDVYVAADVDLCLVAVMNLMIDHHSCVVLY